MLVLTRRERQSFIIQDRDGKFIAEMKVLETTHTGKVIMGFRAAPSIRILRSEMIHGGAQEGKAQQALERSPTAT